jgi:hypothetical protein
LRVDHRHGEACIACRSDRLIIEWSLTSPFFAKRALDREPFCIPFIRCRSCRTAYFDIFVTDIELARLYNGYRGEDYFSQRHSFEPRYTSELNAALGGNEDMQVRRRVLSEALAAGGIVNSFQNVLDHGGDRGQMLIDLEAKRKAVYDISGVVTEENIDRIDQSEMRGTKWDLVLSCHVLEHLTFPAAYLNDILSLGDQDTIFFFEVPNELMRSSRINRSDLHRRWLTWVARHRAVFKFAEFLSSGTRHRFGIVLPFMYIPLTEHLTFYSIRGLCEKLQNHGLEILFAGIGASGHITVLGRKVCVEAP